MNSSKLEELKPSIHKILQQKEKAGALPNLFSEAGFILIPKGDYGIVRKENYRPMPSNITYECRCKHPQENTSKLNPITYKNNYTGWPIDINLRNAMLE